ncbi:hypothetical protein EcWSU1_A015 (plasmid) [Enterobacter ludwigii]|uniref:Uncharacterized protein n=1 Tax=Enterobacter ludwigii TaxID=299767 RepID=G8LQ93_9ENTR|nr:hypothetical protein EcWSU1_A015 [Enterobacter ludwigii]
MNLTRYQDVKLTRCQVMMLAGCAIFWNGAAAELPLK